MVKERQYWVTKHNEHIPLVELSNKHLFNIKKFIERKAEEGIFLEYDEYDEEIGVMIYGDNVKEFLGYEDILREMRNRYLI